MTYGYRSAMAVTPSDAGGPANAVIRARVRQLMARHGTSKAALARAVGKDPSWAVQFLAGKRNLPLKTLDQVARVFGLDAWQLQTAEPGTTRDTNLDGFAAVPLIAKSVGAGRPIDVSSDEIDYVAFQEAFAGRFDRPVAVRVGNDQHSMVPTILPGDLLLIDQDEEARLHPDPRRIYALNIDGGATIKRVELVDHRLIVSSDNLDKERYPTYTTPLDDIDLRAVVVGEIVWIGRYVGTGRKSK